ncbi:MAG: signal recognition particle protein, partial [Desulfobacteraceae bacterium]|nr:signal recognition particle protein [Desulfobacteraceae bacterium]
MFDNLSDKLDSVFRKFKGHGTLNEKNIEAGLKQVRMALLEADVNYRVVKDVILDIKKRSLGTEVMKSLTPGQQVIKIVNDEFTRMMGSSHEGLDLSAKAPVPIMLVGLQGSGKTTTAGKLAYYLSSQGRKPFLVPADVYRPAAIDQLKKIGKQLGFPVFDSNPDMAPLKICQSARAEAIKQGYDTMLLDTAGRLHQDEELMAELDLLKKGMNPSEILLVADAMTGQDAVNIASSFDKRLDLSGVVLTKMDG